MVPRLEGGVPRLPRVPPSGPCQPLPPPFLSHPALLPLASRPELRPGEIVAPPGPYQVGCRVVPDPSCLTLAALGLF